MFDRFTDRARKAMGLSRLAAVDLRHDYIGTEHLLLGLIQEGTGIAADVFKNLDVNCRRLGEEVRKLVTPGKRAVTMNALPFTPGAKRTLELSLLESNHLGHNYIGTEHLLLGLIREEEGVAAKVLLSQNVRLDRCRAEILDLLGTEVGEAAEPADAPEPMHLRVRKVMRLASAQALRFQHEHVGTEHILLGIIEEATGTELPALLLHSLRAETERLMTPGAAALTKAPETRTPAAEAALDLASEAAGENNQVTIGHLIEGLLRQNDGIAAQVLSAAGIRVEDALKTSSRRKGGDDRAMKEAIQVHGEAMRASAQDAFKHFARLSPVFKLARQEAERFLHGYIGTEHVLLGLIAAGGAAAAVLKRLGVALDRVRGEAEGRITRGDTLITAGQIPFTPAARRALELTLEAARVEGTEIREEHLFLGLLREGTGIAAEALKALGITADAVSKELGPRNPPK